MINVSMLEITLTQSTATFGTSQGNDGFQSILTQTMSAKATEIEVQGDGTSEETGKAAGSLDALLSILQQRNPVSCCGAHFLSQGGTDVPSVSATAHGKKDDDEETTLQGLWAMLFAMLEKTSQLVEELYQTVPQEAASSEWSPSEVETEALPAADPATATLPVTATEEPLDTTGEELLLAA
ncbi:MAG: hypothetical protein HQL84_01280 [Magnetococcales bacterium]|nr:hypothetical protein [Magnetococcales bacterium]MBF0148660.1 hypothetical protein [Magnetococcales bacterium]MBF0174091.1 hypothetical protein [Magnetococcales bacterium]MBF0346843.1 hypothetical protein [Magnetococcales bacterium]MBF0631466.1 hypothetical protein [Magnetococcales bacterium]